MQVSLKCMQSPGIEPGPCLPDEVGLRFLSTCHVVANKSSQVCIKFLSTHVRRASNAISYYRYYFLRVITSITTIITLYSLGGHPGQKSNE
jgi:hypothetical protein